MSIVFEVNWSGDGSTWVDETDLLYNVSTFRGRDYASQITGQSSAGQLKATLNNSDGRFSSFNSSSPLYGDILPGRLVRLSEDSDVLWTGYLHRIEPSAALKTLPRADLFAFGPIIQLKGVKISPAVSTGLMTGQIVAAILTAAGWSGGEALDDGIVSVNNWYVQEKDAFEAIQEMEEAEVGFFWEKEDGSVVFEGRYNRLLNHLTPVAIYSDALDEIDYAGIVQQDPLREIFNEVTAQIESYSTQSLAVLWTFGESIQLAPDQSITVIAQYPNPSSGGAQGAYVSAWTTPVVGTDITQTGVSNGDIGVSVVKTATTMSITITNNHASLPATLTLVQARGTAVTRNNPYLVTAADATSQTAYGKRTFPLPSPWYQTQLEAQAACDYLIALKKDPRPLLSLTLQSSRGAGVLAECVGRQISDRVTVVADSFATKLGIGGDFYIESIAHQASPGQPLTTTFGLSAAPAGVFDSFWVLGTSTLGDNTFLGY